MTIRYLTRAIAVALLASLGLSACGGGGGGIVRNTPPPASPPPPSPPPPVSTATGPCPAPNTSDCIVTASGTMLGGRDSRQALSVQLPKEGVLAVGVSRPYQDLSAPPEATYRFAGGTVVESGTLQINFGNEMHSNVQVRQDAQLNVSGIVEGSLSNDGFVLISNEFRGDVLNRGSVVLSGVIDGNVVNDGIFDVNADIYFEPNGPFPAITSNSIYGNYSASSESTTSVALACLAGTCLGGLLVNGRADVAGTLQFREYTDGWGPYPLPLAGQYLVLWAEDGVFGTFDRWTSPGLFIEGDLHYGSNDVWFDLSRISVQAAMTAQGFDGITLASAGNLDDALAAADRFTTLPAGTLATAQRQFLSSASRILYQQDWAQAQRSLDSLAGREHPLLAQHLHQQGMATAGSIGTHVSGRRFDAAATQWSTTLVGNGQFHGFDRWLGPQWLVGGGYLQQGDGGLTSEFGSARRDDRLASAYLHYRGDAWQATAVASAAHSNAQLQRRIDLGDARAHVAHSRPQLALLELHGEIARPMPWAGGSLQPYVALDYGASRSSRFLESGESGFELISEGGRLQQFGGSVGARFMRGWRIGAGRLELQADVSHARALQTSGHLPVAFAGVPDVHFDLGDWETPRASTSLQVGFQAHAGNGWLWSLHANHATANPTGNGWLLGVRKAL